MSSAYRTIVVGNGLIGSAAARHLALVSDCVVLLGPDEPAERSQHAGVFASHYDEGRMTRIVDPHPAWSVTAKRSIERYAGLEEETGIRFFTPSGYLGYGGAGAHYLESSERTGRAHDAEVTRLSTNELRRAYPYLCLPDGTVAICEIGTAGHLSPRRMIEAQNVAAIQQGARIVRDEAVTIRVSANRVEVDTKDGDTLAADTVLIAAGAFTNACGLTDEPLDLTVFARTVALARMDDALMSVLSDMPTIGHAESGAYILPPIAYADGHHYLKIGMGTPSDRRLESYGALVEWFKSDGSVENRVAMTDFLTELIPSLKSCLHWSTATCAVTQTPTGLPFIDYMVPDRVAVVVGGNGKGAKSSDDWGWLAAQLVAAGDWDHPVTRDAVRLSR